MHDLNQLPQIIDPRKLGRAGMLSFLALADKWQLSTKQRINLLGAIPTSTYFDWKQKTEKGAAIQLSHDTLERISYLLGIYKALNILLPNEEQANQWIHKPNTAPLFNGQSALEKMLAGKVVDLADVRRYLDGQRGAIYG